jgi:thiol-disulfide isomerase/thioredoxin
LPSTIEQLHRERRGQRFAVVLVDFRENPDRVAAWVKAKGVTPPILLDRDGAVAAAYRVTATPTVVLLDRDGKMVARAIGPQSWTSGLARQLLDLLVGAP